MRVYFFESMLILTKIFKGGMNQWRIHLPLSRNSMKEKEKMNRLGKGRAALIGIGTYLINDTNESRVLKEVIDG
jgi:hypothetical protein